MIKWLGLLHGPKSNEWRAIMSRLEIISQDKIKIQEETSEYSYSVICQLKANGEVGVCEIRGMGWLMLLEELIPIYDEARKYFGRSVLNPLQEVLDEWFETEVTIISIADFDNIPAVRLLDVQKEWAEEADSLFDLSIYKEIFIFCVNGEIHICCLCEQFVGHPNTMIRFAHDWNTKNSKTPGYPTLAHCGDSTMVLCKTVHSPDEIIDALDKLTNNFSQTLANSFIEFHSE